MRNKNLVELQWKNRKCWKYFYFSSLMVMKALLLNWMPVFMHSLSTDPAAEDVTVTGHLVSWPIWRLNLYWLSWLAEFLQLASVSFLESQKKMGKQTHDLCFPEREQKQGQQAHCFSLCYTLVAESRNGPKSSCLLNSSYSHLGYMHITPGMREIYHK